MRLINIDYGYYMYEEKQTIGFSRQNFKLGFRIGFVSTFSEVKLALTGISNTV